MTQNGKKQEYGSRFLYAENLLVKGKFISPFLTISKVHEPNTLRSADKRLIDKWTIEFEKAKKMLVLCQTNASIIHFLSGEEPGDGWIGTQIQLGARIVKAFGAETTAIRVLPPVGATLRKTLVDRLGRPAKFEEIKGQNENGDSP